MADNNKLELVVEVDVNKANASIKSINTGLSSMEQAASKAARGASAGIDGITVSMAKGAVAGNLLADVIKGAIEWAKKWTVEAAQYAAHTTKMEASMNALAKAHGEVPGAVNSAVEAIKKVGFSTQDAIHAVDRLMIADMHLSKAQGLAKVAKDAAAIENISAGEALEKIMMAIESGASRGLRTLGLYVDLNKDVQIEELKLGRTLSENETKTIRYNAVMREAAKIHGAGAAAAGTAEAQSKKLAREIDELRNAVGQRFQDELKAVVKVGLTMVGWLRDNTDLLTKFGEAALGLSATLATAALAGKIGAIANSVTGLGAALLGNPLALATLGITAAGVGAYAVYDTWKTGRERAYQPVEQQKRDALRSDLFEGKASVADLRKSMSEDQIRELVSGKALPDQSWNFAAAKARIGGGPSSEGPSLDDLKRAAEIRKKQGEAEKSAEDLYMRAIEERKSAEHDMARARIEDSLKIIQATSSEAIAARESMNVARLSLEERRAGIEKIRNEETREIAQRSTIVDEKGAVRHFQLEATTLDTIHKATAEKIAAFDMKFNEEEARRVEIMWKALAERTRKLIDKNFFEPMRQDLYVLQQQQEWQDRIDAQARDASKQAVEQRKDLELARLDTVDAVTIQDKLRLEQMKTAIEVQAIKDRTKIELDEITVRTEHQVDEARKAAMAQGIFDDARLDAIAAKIEALGQHERDALQQSAVGSVDVAQAKGAAQMQQTVTTQYRSIFQTLKQEAGGVFDALLTKSQSVWSAIGNSLKTAMLTAIKDVVTSRVAAALMGLFTGTRVSFAQGGGMLGGTGGGSAPVFGGSGSGPLGSLASLGGMLGLGGGGTQMPATTPPFVSGGSGGSGGGGLLSMLGIGGNGGTFGRFGGLKDFLGFGGGGVQYAPGQATTWAASSLGQKASALGRSNAAMLAGGMLVMDGLQRGGWTGMAEDTAGGAMIGFKFGGPMGAAIGAIAGAVAGMVRMMVKGAQEKAREKIKALYGVDISDKGILKQIVDTAKSAYGGNLDLAIRSQQVRDLIQLYGMSTGQRVTGMKAPMTASTLIESGGSLYQGTSYSNGSALPGLGGLTSLDKIVAGTPSGGGTIVIPLQIDSTAVGSVVIQNGRVVAQGAITAMKNNDGRRELTALQLSPGLLTS